MAIRSCDSDQLESDVAVRSSGLIDCQKKVLDVLLAPHNAFIAGATGRR